VEVADDLPPSERPTPRETGAHERAKIFRGLAVDMAERLDRMAYAAAQIGTTDIQRGVDARRLAAKARVLGDCFAAWERGEATYEQRIEDHATWLILQADVRQLEAKAPRTKNTSPAMPVPRSRGR
jgi:hypothetical protein